MEKRYAGVTPRGVGPPGPVGGEVTVAWRKKDRLTARPSRVEVDLRAIPLLRPGGWKLLSLDEITLVGAVEKNYLRFGDPESSGFIAKKGRLKGVASYRECVTEEIISKIGAHLPLRMARSRLVRISATDVRFMSRNFVVDRQLLELRHGIELVAEYLGADKQEVEFVFGLRDKGAEHEFYSIDTILAVLTWKCGEHLNAVLKGFARMIAFDAFIGAPDRHAMNWGLLLPIGRSLDAPQFAPVFDTARGMFREQSDDELARRSKTAGPEKFIEKYAEGSRPVFGTGKPGNGNHFELIEWALVTHPEQLGVHIQRFFRAVSVPALERMLKKRFRRIVTPLRIKFIVDLLSFRVQRIREIFARLESTA